MFAENGHDQNHLYCTIRENKHQAPKSEKTDSNIVKLPWMPIIGPKIRKELRKTEHRICHIYINCKTVKIYHAITKVNYYQTVTPVFTN